MFSLAKFIRSFRYSLNGLSQIFREEHSFRIQIFIGFLVLILSLCFNIKVWELVVVILVMALIFVLELINTVLERFADAFKPRLHPFVEEVKDIMAAVVLVFSVAAVLIGLLIFTPYFITLFRNISKIFL
jgi:diacylglycerol kinase